MPHYECGNCGRTDFDSFSSLQDHDCEEWTDDDPDGGATPPLVADGGVTSKYTNPTGPGYRGVYSADGYTVEVSVAAMAHIDWTTDTDVVAIDDENEAGVQLVEKTAGCETIGTAKMQNRGHGLLVHVRPAALRSLEDFESGEDVRVYEYDAGLTLVPRENDPFVADGGDA
ncbi:MULTISPECIES: hypothetical protein [Halobacterium]|uniref:hypothetical protein n=1 Tax=Halobacterium TaxID=2239 RepID=UPI00073EFF81|nr:MULTISPECIES: hypothetical protein [Halobacterium]MCG1002849.1 hypothetical protein [Halobacterium noricense]